MTAFLASLAVVFLAEMGDKTQLLAVAFASRFRWRTVLGGVLAATAANHLFAVAAGTYLTTIIPLAWIKIAAAASFVLFGLWTLRGDTLKDEDKKFDFKPFWTVFVAFFIAEMGDKTQLATVALAVKFNAVIPVWFGTTSGMLAADAAGIAVGSGLHNRVPEKWIRWFAALVFIAFGLWGLYDSVL